MDPTMEPPMDPMMDPMSNPEASDVVLFAINQLDNSGQSGWAMLTSMGDDTRVRLSLSGGTMASLDVHIHVGQCGAPEGIRHILGDIADGVSDATLEGVTLESLLVGNLAINAHSEEDATNLTACGNIPIAGSYVTIDLNELNDSGQSGWATLTSRGNDLEVVSHLHEGTMTSGAVHIHEGQCDSLGGVANPLSSFVDRTSSTLIAGLSLDGLMTGGFAINAHNADNPGTFTACGNIPADPMDPMTDPMSNPEASDVLLIALNELNSSGQSGWAKLTAMGNDTHVVLSLSEGTMVSGAVHLHMGQCDSLGGVKYPLSSFSYGVSDTTLENATLESLLVGNLAINAHRANEPVTLTACGNIPPAGSFLTIALDELNDSGQSGWATLSSRGNDLEIVSHLHEGTMTSGAVHIHEGQCESLAGVANPLSSFVDRTSSTLIAGLSLDSLMTGGFAINAHNADDPGTYTACGNIPADPMDPMMEPAMEPTMEPTTEPIMDPTMDPTTEPTMGSTTVQLDIVNFALPDVTVTVGDTINWNQLDTAPHTSTSGTDGVYNGSGWDSPLLNRGEAYSHTFTQAGTFAYTCRLHPSMSGTVTVVDGSGASGTSMSQVPQSVDGY